MFGLFGCRLVSCFLFRDKFFELLGNAVEAANKRQEEVAPKLFWGQRPSAPDYGLSENNPICSPSLSDTEAYLSRLCTKDGQKFTWKGYTSLRTNCNGVENVGIDKYDLYLNGSFFSSVYFAPYSGDAIFPPAGLFFADTMRDYATAREVFECAPTSVEVCFQLDDAEEEAKRNAKIASVESPISSATTVNSKGSECTISTIVCKNCGKQLPDDSLFCQYCGELLDCVDLKKANEGNSIDNEKASNLYNATTENEAANSLGGVAKKEKTTRRVPIIAIIVLSVLLCGLAGLSFYQHFSYSETLQVLRAENDSLKENNTKLEEEKARAVSERNTARRERDQAKRGSREYETVKSWVTQYGKGFHVQNSYYAASNIIAVKVGETVNLSITYTGNRTLWLNTTDTCCKADWGSGWSGNTTTVKISGISAGTSELIFSLGNTDQADSNESFRVLVIVV